MRGVEGRSGGEGWRREVEGKREGWRGGMEERGEEWSGGVELRGVEWRGLHIASHLPCSLSLRGRVCMCPSYNIGHQFPACPEGGRTHQ